MKNFLIVLVSLISIFVIMGCTYTTNLDGSDSDINLDANTNQDLDIAFSKKIDLEVEKLKSEIENSANYFKEQSFDFDLDET